MQLRYSLERSPARQICVWSSQYKHSEKAVDRRCKFRKSPPVQIAQGLPACNDSNCLCQIVKKAELCPNCEKIRTPPPFLRVLGILLLNARLGTGTSYARVMSIFKIQMFMLIYFTNLVVQNAAKQGMTKYHPQKSLSNNARSVVESPPLSW